MTTALAIAPQQATTWLTEDQQKIVRDSFLNGASPSDAAVLMEAARSLGLNPLLKQIHFVKRWDSQKRCEVWAFQVGIDGFRSIAEDSGEYDGQDAPEWVEDKDHPIKCTIKIYRKGVTRPFVGEAYWDEYVQTKKEGGPNYMWARGKHFMLAKCAEAIALRKAFPRKLSGVYIPEEIREEKEAAPSTPPSKGLGGIPTKAMSEPQQKTADSQLASWDNDQIIEQIMKNSEWLDKARKDDPRRAKAQDTIARLQAELNARTQAEPSDADAPGGAV